MAYDSVFKANLFAGQCILVTGGGSGIGRCTAHELAALGAHVVLVGRQVDKLEKTAGEIRGDGGSAGYRGCDIRDEDAVKAMVATVLAEHGSIQHLVNNAGGQYPAPLASIDQKGFETVVRTNLVGGFLVAREVFNQSMSRTGGSIVNMLADMWGGMPGMGHSGAARAGMDNFTKTAAVEWGHAGVRVNAVAPGWIASSGMDTYPESMQALIRSLKDHVPLQRIGSEAEVAAAIVFLLSPGAAFISGTTVRIDGAASLGSRAFPLSQAKPGQGQAYNGFHRAHLPDVLQEQER
ncbi:SDR family oxidoreductase [Pseudomonas lalucatii]|uniref:Peroxisomal trans-2-enoyl-CoA reductase n=1 Tax=Pseudomonas lalucatii TaxID=1424203 RepID=A0ABS5PXY2_9PSED|nr:SDR family oxidoreductase [Pseudomonas lalucatii]MBS7661174.1 SDR family oxidoreductase [Pseudomonas lalucatii]MBS7691650.1 SDR family oxidoreductase [Pseudomonas lalucatii]MBS7724244.1 SDR family oxidoreductase [Pseudomonas lalucatii]QVM87767.1 SDR family oxidoreductase [Pseudomonas lalucatii]